MAIDNRTGRTGAADRVGSFCSRAYVVLYAATLFAMVRFGGFDAGDALGVFAVLGVGFSLIAWLLTLGVKPLAVHGPRAGQGIASAFALHDLRWQCSSLTASMPFTAGFQASRRIHWSSSSQSSPSLSPFLHGSCSLASATRLPELAPLALPTSHMLAFVGWPGCCWFSSP